MSFQAYLDNIQTKMGKNPRDWRAYAVEKVWLTAGARSPGPKAGVIIADLKQNFGLGHGHAMAIVALLKKFC